MNLFKKHTMNILCFAIMAMCLFSIGKYFVQFEWVSFGVILLLNLFMGGLAFISFRHHWYFLLSINAALCFILFFNTNYLETSLYNFDFLINAILSTIAFIVGIMTLIVFEKHLIIKKYPLDVALTSILLLSLVIYPLSAYITDTNKSTIENSIYSVPSFVYQDCEKEGKIDEIEYSSKAYTTDNRDVSKKLYVYTPYNYDENKQYNILYLLHGTGDDAESWLIKNSKNKKMLDYMIGNNIIEPLIIVTPTFYTENDSANDLDQYTYHFKDELLNDIMPVVEDKYSTYATSLDGEGFLSSRNHRAFAGLSRGAVTTSRSILCGALDYFSYFGLFSGMRTSIEYFQEHLQSEKFKSFPINYLYMTSGTFDFSLHQQIIDYRNLLKIEDRLILGKNTSFDVFPFKKHSFSSWNLALYNFVQKIF